MPAVKEFDRESLRLDEKPPQQAAGDFTLVLYPSVALLDGRHAAPSVAQELPDPVTKVTWDNYACLSPAASSSGAGGWRRRADRQHRSQRRSP